MINKRTARIFTALVCIYTICCCCGWSRLTSGSPKWYRPTQSTLTCLFILDVLFATVCNWLLLSWIIGESSACNKLGMLEVLLVFEVRVYDAMALSTRNHHISMHFFFLFLHPILLIFHGFVGFMNQWAEMGNFTHLCTYNMNSELLELVLRGN